MFHKDNEKLYEEQYERNSSHQHLCYELMSINNSCFTYEQRQLLVQFHTIKSWTKIKWQHPTLGSNLPPEVLIRLTSCLCLLQCLCLSLASRLCRRLLCRLWSLLQSLGSLAHHGVSCKRGWTSSSQKSCAKPSQKIKKRGREGGQGEGGEGEKISEYY